MAGERDEYPGYSDWMMGALAQQGIDPVPMGSLASDQDNQASSPLRITVRPKSFQDYLDASSSGQQPADQLIPPPRFGFDDPANPVNQTIGQKAHELLDLGATPRDLLRGDPRYQVTPEVPGQWSERDQYRQDQLDDERATRAATLGFHMTGYGAAGSPLREYGLGAGGGRMVTPPPRGRPNLSEMFAPKPPAAIGIQGVDEAAANISPAMRGLQERGAMLGAQLQSTEEAAGGALKGISDIFKQDMGQAIQRDAMVRGRSGRPIQTAPLPIGTEDAILQQGYNRALGLEPSPGPQPPFMQAAARKGPAMGDVAAQPALTLPGIKAYHGSPYDFDRFDMSKIGTGEGAQSYGHGLYFAEAEPTALSYKNAMRVTDMDWPISGTDLTVPAWVARSSRTPTGLEEVRNNFLNRLNESKQEHAAGDWNAATRIYHQQRIVDALDAIKKGAELKQPGHMYEVNINAHPEQFLDWDKPLSKQPQITDALVNSFKSPSAERRRMEQWTAPTWGDNPPGTSYLDAIHAGTKYRALAGDLGSWDKASHALREQGIPGIKYLDQGSRVAGGGTSNYVLFDDKLIDILRKYGIAGMLGGGAGGMGELARQNDYQQ